MTGLFVLAAIGVACVAIVLAMAVRPLVGGLATVVVFALTAAQRDSLVDLDWMVSGYSIDVRDIVVAALFAAAGLRIGRGSLPRQLRLLIGTLFAITTVHVVRGIVEYGLQPALNGARGWLWFAAPLAFACTWRSAVQTQLLAFTASIFLVFCAIVGFAETGFHSVDTRVSIDGVVRDSRPLTAAGALVILQGAILATHFFRARPALRVAIPVGLLAVVVVLQHRTVWAGAGLVLLLGFSFWSRRTVQIAPQRAFAALGLILIALPLVGWSLFQSSTLTTSLRETATPDSTLRWRTDSWRELLAEHHSFTELAIGLPSGHSWQRYLFGVTTDAAPHSAYVEALLRFGVLGPLLLGLFWLLAIRHVRSRPWAFDIPPEVVIAIVASQMVFAISYPLGALQGLLLGSFLTAAVRARAAEPVENPASGGRGLALVAT